MEMVDWIILGFAGFCFTVASFVLWVGPPTRRPGARSTRKRRLQGTRDKDYL
jgi:hypothetical protein